MADERAEQHMRDIEEAARETREPAQAKELRARDTERMLEYLEDAEQRAAQADATLSATSRQLQANAAELERRKRELQRTGEIAREVTSNAAEIEQLHVKPPVDRAIGQRADDKRDARNASVADQRSPSE